MASRKIQNQNERFDSMEKLPSSTLKVNYFKIVTRATIIYCVFIFFDTSQNIDIVIDGYSLRLRGLRLRHGYAYSLSLTLSLTLADTHCDCLTLTDTATDTVTDSLTSLTLDWQLPLKLNDYVTKVYHVHAHVTSNCPWRFCKHCSTNPISTTNTNTPQYYLYIDALCSAVLFGIALTTSTHATNLMSLEYSL